MDKKALLEKRLKEIEEKIRETEMRLPAHSVKPAIMTELLSYEDERDQIMDDLRSLS